MELEISREQSRAVEQWIAQRKGKRVSDDVIGARSWVVGGEAVIITTDGKPDGLRTNKIIAGQQVLASLEVAGVVSVPREQKS